MIIGVRTDGRKELVVLADGFRESAESWADLLRDYKRRGMPSAIPVFVGPLLPHVNRSGRVPSLPHEEGPRAWLLSEPGQSAAGRAVAGVTVGLVVGWFLAVARVSRSALRAWIC